MYAGGPGKSRGRLVRKTIHSTVVVLEYARYIAGSFFFQNINEAMDESSNHDISTDSPILLTVYKHLSFLCYDTVYL